MYGNSPDRGHFFLLFS